MEIAIYFSEKLVLFLLLLYNYVKFKTVKKNNDAKKRLSDMVDFHFS